MPKSNITAEQILDNKADGFTPSDDLVVLTHTNRGEPICAYESEFKGKTSFHIRALWEDDSEAWHPGKGVSVPAANKAEFLRGIAALAGSSTTGSVVKLKTSRKIRRSAA